MTKQDDFSGIQHVHLGELNFAKPQLFLMPPILAKELHPRKLTWIPKMMVCKRSLLLDIAIFGIYVSKKSPTVGPIERTPKKPEYLIALSRNLLY